MGLLGDEMQSGKEDAQFFFLCLLSIRVFTLFDYFLEDA